MTTDSPLHIALQSYGVIARRLTPEALQNSPHVLVALAGEQAVDDPATRARLAEWLAGQLRTEIADIKDLTNRRIAEAILATTKDFEGKTVTQRCKFVRENDRGFTDELYKRRRRAVLSELAARVEKAYRFKDTPPLFFAGRYTDLGTEDIAVELGKALSALPITLLAGGSDAGVAVGYAMAKSLCDNGTYASERIKLFVRTASTRLGRVYEPLGDVSHLNTTPTNARYIMLRQARLVLLFGGGNGTAEEAAIGTELGLPIVPIATTGGTAHRCYLAHAAAAKATLPSAQWRHYRQLNHPEPAVAIHAAIQLITYHLGLEAQ
ncbi:hypothetical protein [Nocardia tenerifensis]|nr:hypothetical protein [Nocardia tenerifensis]